MDNKVEEYYLFFSDTNNHLWRKPSIIAGFRLIKYCKRSCYICMVGYNPITILRKTPTKKLGNLMCEGKKIIIDMSLTGDNLSLKYCIDHYFVEGRYPKRIWLIKK